VFNKYQSRKEEERERERERYEKRFTKKEAIRRRRIIFRDLRRIQNQG
jgi:hypothetical protein